MEPREHRLLKAVAKYLTDYCGEDARRRWEAKLSDKERERLARASDPILDAWTWFVEAIREVTRIVGEVLSRVVLLISEALAAAWDGIVGPDTKLFGGEAF